MIPLSTRMRPENLDEFVGQGHFMYSGSLFYNAIKNKNFESAIFFGPSGTGKTTLARLIVAEMDANYYEINASTTGIKELKELLDKIKNNYFGFQSQQNYLFIDEFHRWNKLQQDSLLKALEDGLIRMIAGTTENPYYSINNAILSRIRSIYEFKKLENEDIYKLLVRALKNEEKGLGKRTLEWDEDALRALADLSSGDARIALDTLGFIGENLKDGRKVDLSIVGEAMQRQTTFYDRNEDKYNLLSALQKSIRGSDPDAAIHYLARLLDGGADLQMIGRRLLVIASEDIGMAYPQAISIANSCVQASLLVGLPEGRINLSQAVIFLASCPKSNSSIIAIDQAIEDLHKKEIDDVPFHLRGSHRNYKYPHDYGGYVKQQYLPDNLYKKSIRYYKPTNNGKERVYKQFLESLKEE